MKTEVRNNGKLKLQLYDNGKGCKVERNKSKGLSGEGILLMGKKVMRVTRILEF